MKFVWGFLRWLLVGIAIVFLCKVAIAQAYIQVLSLLLAILFLIPGAGNVLTKRVPLLRSSFVRSILGICLLIYAVASFGVLTLQDKEARIQQHMGLLNVDAIVRAQKFHYLENGQFAASLEELKKSPTNDEAYHYTITVTPLKAVITAAASSKYRLRSYTGILLRDEQNSNTESLICQTRFISKVPPEAPEIPDFKQQKLVCPANAKAVIL